MQMQNIMPSQKILLDNDSIVLRGSIVLIQRQKLRQCTCLHMHFLLIWSIQCSRMQKSVLRQLRKKPNITQPFLFCRIQSLGLSLRQCLPSVFSVSEPILIQFSIVQLRNPCFQLPRVLQTPLLIVVHNTVWVFYVLFNSCLDVCLQYFQTFPIEKSKSMHDWLEMCTTGKQSIYNRKLKPLQFLKNWCKCLIKTLQFSEQSCKVLTL